MNSKKKLQNSFKHEKYLKVNSCHCTDDIILIYIYFWWNKNWFPIFLVQIIVIITMTMNSNDKKIDRRHINKSILLLLIAWTSSINFEWMSIIEMWYFKFYKFNFLEIYFKHFDKKKSKIPLKYFLLYSCFFTAI